MHSQRRRLNPLDRDGNVSKYSICESKFHWVRDCPDAYESQNFNAERSTETISLFQSPNHDVDQMRVFVGETLSCAVLDSGCTQTVCGKTCLDCYTDSLMDENVIAEKPSTSAFKFGNVPHSCQKRMW